MTRICIDAGPVENTHRSRGIGKVTKAVMDVVTSEMAARRGATLTIASRRPLRQPPPGVEWVQRGWTSEWTGVNDRLHEVLVDYTKAAESALFLPQDLRHAAPDIVLTFDPGAIPLSRTFKTVAVLYDLIPIRFRNEYLRRGVGLGRLLYEWDLRRLRRADHVIAISEATKNDGLELLGIPPAAISVVHLGVDPTRFTPVDAENARRTAAERFGLHRPYFLYVGGFDSRKNLRQLLTAYSQLPQPAPELAIAGPLRGPGARLRQEVAALGGSERIRWLGYVPDDDLPLLYGGSVALTFPSRYEGFGLPLLEAMSCGAPVLTSSVSSMPEVAGDAALYCNPDSIESIVQGLRSLVESGSLRQELRQKGFRRAKRFSWTETAERLLDICVRVAADPRDHF